MQLVVETGGGVLGAILRGRRACDQDPVVARPLLGIYLSWRGGAGWPRAPWAGTCQERAGGKPAAGLGG